MVSKKSRSSILINVGSLIAIIVGVINMVTLREIWILFAVVSVLVVLTIYILQEKRKPKHKPVEN
jgi:membrane protein implicated in regulation of membrane protease activity